MAFAAIANNGVLMHPTLLDRIVSPEGKTLRQFRPREKRRVLSEENAREMRDMLHVAVDDGTGKAARVPNYAVGGKTGTALVAVNGSYSARKYAASFVGMAPIDNPQFVVLVTIYDPSPYYYAGIVAAPLFQKVMRQALMLYKVPPSYIDAPEKSKSGEI
jgi:stage V sporulation protein D (sporulation-specific penicillin-binding protein)